MSFESKRSPLNPHSAPPTPERRRSIIVAALVIGAALVAGALLFRRPEAARMPAPSGIHVDQDSITLSANAPQWQVIRVDTAVASKGSWSQPFPARFKVDEARAARVGSPLAGRVTSVFVELGQAVKTGTALYSVSSPDIAGLRAEREKAKVDVEASRGALERVKAMVEARALPAKDELETDQRLRQAELDLKLSEAKLASLRVSSRGDNDYTVLAPRDGVIIEKNVLPAQRITADQTLLGIADLSTLWVVAELFEADAAALSAGVKARIVSPSLPGFAAEVAVDLVSSVVDPVRHTVAVRTRLSNPDAKIRPNTYAEMRFFGAEHGGLEIAASAVLFDGGAQYVYVQSEKKGRFTRRVVTAGPVRDTRVLVTQGLVAGDVVVEEGAILLDNQIQITD